LSLALALYHQNKNEEALSSIEQVIELVPEHKIARFYQAMILRDLDNTQSALLIFQDLFNSSTDLQQQNRIAMEIKGLLRLLSNENQ